MEPISIALGLAEFVPGVVRWLSGDKAGEVAENVVDTAKRITGQDDPHEAMNALRNDPQLQIQLQQAMTPVIIAQYENETRRLESVNATMRAEAQSKDGFVRRWRPMLGYVVTFSWGLQMFGLVYIIIFETAKSANVIKAMAELSVMWGVALSILGINVTSRSKDKQVAAGQSPGPGILGALAQRVIGNGHR